MRTRTLSSTRSSPKLMLNQEAILVHVHQTSGIRRGIGFFSRNSLFMRKNRIDRPSEGGLLLTPFGHSN